MNPNPTPDERGAAGPGLLELLGLLALGVGLGAIVAAAALVSVALAVLAAGAFLTLAGVIAVYVAAQLEQRQAAQLEQHKTAAEQPARRQPPIVVG